MTEHSEQIDEIFWGALQITSAADRATYLDQKCRGDAALRELVGKLLLAQPKAQQFLEQPLAVNSPSITERPLTEHPGTVIGPYKLLEQIGEGGFGVVFMAEQTAPVKRKVALKVIKPGMDTRQVIARFEAERQALALMDHPNIAKVLDAGATETGRPFFVMELVKGVPITDFCDEHQLVPRERLELFVTVCQAVQHAHQKGVIHRDLKPSNVLVACYDDKAVPKIIDFGVAKVVSQRLTERTMFTQYGQIVGTIEYMSPEQAQFNQLDVDTRSDIYSLGVLLYELLTGETPFDKQRLRTAAFDELLRIIREEEPPRPSARLSSSETLPSIAANRHTEPKKLTALVRGELDWIVMKCLEKDRSRRYETANGLMMDVQRYLSDEPVLACPPSAGYRLRKFARRNKAALATGALVSVALVAAVVVLAVSNVLVTRERNAKGQALAEKVQALADKQTALNEKQAALTQSQANFAEAKRQQQIATDQTALAKRRLYASQMNLAMQAWHNQEVPRVLELLEGQRPEPDEEDLRGFEWYYLWRLCNGGRRQYLHGHTDAVTALAYSPDGKTLASASWDRTVRLWDAATGELQGTLQGHSRQIWDVAFSPDGKTLASGGKDTESLILWDVGTGQPRHTIAGSVDGLTFSRDGSIIAGGLVTESGTHVKLWDVASGAERVTFADAGAVVGFLADGKSLVTAWHQYLPTGEIRFWDLETGSRQRMIPVHFVVAILSPDATRVATTSSAHGGGVEFWDTATAMSLGRLPDSDAVSGAIAFSPDGKLLAGSTKGRTVTVWDIETGRQLATDVHVDPVQCIAFSPDVKTLASATTGGAIKLWDMTPVEEATTIGVGEVTSLRFDPGGRTLLVGHSGPTKLVDVAAGQEVALLPASGVMAISADANVLAGPADAELCALWDVRAGRAMAGVPLPRPTDTYPGFTLSPDGKLFAAYYRWRRDNTVKLWDIASREPRTLTIDPPQSNRLSVECAEFSPDGKLLAAGFMFQWVTVWDVTTGKVKLQFSQKPAMMWVRSLAFSPDSKSLAVGTDVGAVTLWEVESGRRLASFRGHTSNIHALAFSPDGRTLASAGADETVRLWDLITGQERSTLTGHRGPVVMVQFSPDGNTLATAGWDGTVKLWRAATDPEALARHRSVEDPNAHVAAQFGGSARRIAKSRNPVEHDPAKAVELAKKAIALDPHDPRHWTSLAIAHAYAGEWQAAVASHQKAIDLDPHGTAPHIGFGNALLDMERLDEAIACYQKAMEIDPRCAIAHNNLGIALRQHGRLTLDEAIAHCRETIGLDPTFAPAHVSLGFILCEQKKWDEAVACFQRSIGLDSNNVDAWYSLGVALKHQQELDEAIACFRRAIELGPEDAYAHLQLGGVLYLQKKWDESLVSLRKCLTLDPEHSNAHWIIGWCLMEQRQHDEAIASWRKLIEMDPEDYRAYHAIGIALSRQGMPEQAVASFQDAIRIKPGYALSHGGLGDALCRLGKHAEAITALRQAIVLDPNLDEAHNDLAWLLATCADQKLRDPGEALKLARQAVALAPDKGAFHHTLAVAHYRVGDYKASLAALGRSMELRNGGDSFDWFFLSMANWRLGNEAEARRWYDRAVQWMDDNRPDDEELRSFRVEAAALLEPPVPSAPTLELRPGATNKATQVDELQRETAALDERPASAPADRREEAATVIAGDGNDSRATGRDSAPDSAPRDDN